MADRLGALAASPIRTPGPDPALDLLCRDADGDGRCSTIELVHSADRVLGSRAAHALSARHRLGEWREYGAAVRGLDQGRALIVTAADQLRRGAPCEAAASYRRAGDTLHEADVVLRAAVVQQHQALLQTPSLDVNGNPLGPDGDVTDAGMRSAHLALRRTLVEDDLERAMDAQTALDDACRSVGKRFHRRGRVERVDDALGTFTLAGGIVVGQVFGAAVRGTIVEGGIATVKGITTALPTLSHDRIAMCPWEPASTPRGHCCCPHQVETRRRAGRRARAPRSGDPVTMRSACGRGRGSRRASSRRRRAARAGGAERHTRNGGRRRGARLVRIRGACAE